jgi:hypothetical protein
MPPPHTVLTATSTSGLRAERAWLLARYDGGKVSPAIFDVIREIETNIVWAEHRGGARS